MMVAVVKYNSGASREEQTEALRLGLFALLAELIARGEDGDALLADCESAVESAEEEREA